MAEWSNWAGNVRATPQRLVVPRSIDELQTEVASANRQGWTVRAAGSGHSFSPLCESPGLLVDLSAITGIEAIDATTGDATILAGTKIYDIGQPLFEAGRALGNQGDIDRQAIAGAVGTGTHGTGRGFGSFSSMVKTIELVAPSGDLVTIDAADANLLSASALSMGMLGIVTRLQLRTLPAFRLHERSRPLDFESCLDGFLDVEEANRHAEFWWIPPLDSCVLKTLTETSEEPAGGGPEPDFPPGTIERYLKPEKIDWSSRVYSTTRNQPFVECEYALPLAAGPDAMHAVRTLMQSKHPDVRWAVEYRTVPAESLMLSPTRGEECVTISVHQAIEAPWEAFMRDCDALFRAHGGRPHWGKLHWLTRYDIDELYPHIDSFRQIRSRFDPDGTFLNAHLRPLFAS